MVVGAAGSDLSAQPVYEIYAFQYATHLGVPKSIFVYGAGLDGALLKNVAYSYWVIIGGGRRILFDTGFSSADIAKPGLVNFRSPKELLPAISIEPEGITDIVLSHMHWDHAGNVAAFPGAEKIWIQREEFEFTAGRGLQSALTFPYLRLPDVIEVLTANAAGRVELLEGEVGLFPGIDLYVVPRGHSYASQFMVVNTKSGKVVMAADSASTWENIETNMPGTIGIDLLQAADGIKRIKTFVKDSKDIIPGHESGVYSVYPLIAAGVAKIR